MVVLFVALLLVALSAHEGSSADKPTVPVAISLRLSGNPAPNGDTMVDVLIVPTARLSNVSIDVSAGGIASVVTRRLSSPRSLEASTPFTATIPVHIAPQGRGTFSVTLKGTDRLGVTFGSTATIYLLADEVGLVTGGQGFSQLERGRLEELHRRGFVTQEKYEAEMRRLRGGGAAETNR